MRKAQDNLAFVIRNFTKMNNYPTNSREAQFLSILAPEMRKFIENVENTVQRGNWQFSRAKLKLHYYVHVCYSVLLQRIRRNKSRSNATTPLFLRQKGLIHNHHEMAPNNVHKIILKKYVFSKVISIAIHSPLSVFYPFWAFPAPHRSFDVCTQTD